MLRDALLTLLWTNTGRQQHGLLPQRGDLTSLLELLATVVVSEELVTIAIRTGQPLASLHAPTAGLRVLITLGPSAGRILSSGWWRPEAPAPWQRLWFPQPLGTLQRTAVASAFLPCTGACSASSSGATP